MANRLTSSVQTHTSTNTDIHTYIHEFAANMDFSLGWVATDSDVTSLHASLFALTATLKSPFFNSQFLILLASFFRCLLLYLRPAKPKDVGISKNNGESRQHQYQHHHHHQRQRQPQSQPQSSSPTPPFSSASAVSNRWKRCRLRRFRDPFFSIPPSDHNRKFGR